MIRADMQSQSANAQVENTQAPVASVESTGKVEEIDLSGVANTLTAPFKNAFAKLQAMFNKSQ